MATDRLLPTLISFACLAVTGCTSTTVDSPPPSGSSVPGQLPPDAVPKREPKSRYGNPPVYEVFGVRYEVMDTSYGYKERGVASWYGNKFHGKATSSQEPYDMHAMTAAHKSLPLPTYVRVRNLKNGKSVVVRVNDRGPFIDNRIIDLSYSAAIKIDMVREGTSLVEVTALSYDAPPETVARAEPQRKTSTAPGNPANDEHSVFVQVGAYGDVDNAKRRFALLRESGIENAFVHKDNSRSPALYRIRIGPIDGVNEYDRLVIKLDGIGVGESHLVTD